MIFEFTAFPDFNFICSFASQFNIPVNGDTLIIPAVMGKGTIRTIEFGPSFRIVLHRYIMKEDFIIRRKASKEIHDLITIFFYTNEDPFTMGVFDQPKVFFSKNTASAIQVATCDLNSEIRFPANTEIYFTVLGITSNHLSTLLHEDKGNVLLEKILNGKESLLFFESMTAETLKILKQLMDAYGHGILSNFYYKIKAMELLYLILNRLMARESKQYQQVISADAEQLIKIRDFILADLSKPPVLSELAQLSGMSETKMKQLFKQVFGDSIYQYYLERRLEEAAFLLKHASLSVSEVGHKLGFSNLSHFSRLFEKNYGLTPKKFVSVG